MLGLVFVVVQLVRISRELFRNSLCALKKDFGNLQIHWKLL